MREKGKGEICTDENVEIFGERNVDIIGDGVEVAGGPTESNSSGEHRPKS